MLYAPGYPVPSPMLSEYKGDLQQILYNQTVKVKEIGSKIPRCPGWSSGGMKKELYAGLRNCNARRW